MDVNETRLDGNAIGGLLLDLFGVEMTAATCVCNTCGSLDVVAHARVYLAAGAVVRCAHCEHVLMRIVRGSGGRVWLDLTGIRSLELRISD